jgi:methylmalonyl-CoA mutase cobalamin-binding domain/chain
MTNRLIPDRDDLLADLPHGIGHEWLATGRSLARDWTVGPSPYLSLHGVTSEAERKRRAMANREVLLHAQIGYRDPALTGEAWSRIHDAGLEAGMAPDRYGICLDWSMGYRREDRAGRRRGTGLLLDDAEDFCSLTARAPVAPHFGDFVLGFPAAVENCQAALAAGSTCIGNLGQYFTFRLPDWDDDIDCTRATVTALGLAAAQDREILVHSNLDDGFAAQFTDMTSALGAVLIEKRLVEELCGAGASHCFGHHFTDPLPRLGFQTALAELNPTPGSMIYGATMGYRGDEVENYAALASYLSMDILSQKLTPSGHAINPVPVTENSRIPDIGEVIDAQRFAIRLVEGFDGADGLIDPERLDDFASRLVEGARRFEENLNRGLRDRGYDLDDPAELMLCLRRLGGRVLEQAFGAGDEDARAPLGRRAIEPSPTVTEIARMVARELAAIEPDVVSSAGNSGHRIIVASTDVHEHGKHFVEEAWRSIGLDCVDAGVSAHPDDLAAKAIENDATVIAISTYNGVARSFITDLLKHLPDSAERPLILIGGRLNEIAEGSNTSLPGAVEEDISRLGAIPCANLEDALKAMSARKLSIPAGGDS